MEPDNYLDFWASAKRYMAVAIAVAVGLGAPLLVFLKYDDIAYGIGQLGDRLSKAQIGSVSLEFSAGSIQKNVRSDLFQHLHGADKMAIAQDISALRPDTVVRLLSVGALDKTCDFELPTVDMVDNYAADIFLHQRNLVHMDFDDAKRNAVLTEVKAREHASGKKSDIGYPLRCYNLALTPHGMDVKTAIIYVFGATFADKAETRSAPAAEKPHNAKR
jgi:hypothetical protein